MMPTLVSYDLADGPATEGIVYIKILFSNAPQNIQFDVENRNKGIVEFCAS